MHFLPSDNERITKKTQGLSGRPLALKRLEVSLYAGLCPGTTQYVILSPSPIPNPASEQRGSCPGCDINIATNGFRGP